MDCFCGGVLKRVRVDRLCLDDGVKEFVVCRCVVCGRLVVLGEFDEELDFGGF
jgi:hypothetical protein